MYNNRYHSKSSLEEASEAAAKVNAMLIAEGKLKLSQVNQHYQSKAKAGGLFVLDIEINDAPITCRNILTKGTTQEHIMKLSGAAISTRGRYIHPEEKSKVAADDKPLFLYIQATTQQAINIAAKRINEILKDGQGKPAWNEHNNNNNQLIHPPHVPVNTLQPPPQTHQPPPTTYLRPPPTEPAMVTFLQEKLYIGLEHAPPNFDVKNKIIGPAGSYLRHVMGESGAIATLCGKGSGFGDSDSIEPMHIQIQHPTMEGLQQAKALSSNLIQTVQQEYAQFQQALAAMPQPMTPNQTPVYMEVPGQTSLTGGTLLGPPGIATITTLTQPLTGLPPPGMQPAQGMVGLPASSQAVSMTSSLPPTSMINVAQAMGSAPGSVMLPTSSSYTTMAITSPLVASPLPSGQMLSNMDGGNVSNENVMLVPNTSVPPPILQGPPPQPQQFEINNPNNQFIALPSEGQIIVSGTPQPGSNQVTVVGPPQAVIPPPGPLPAIITAPNGQTMELVQTSQGPPPPQSIPIVGQGQPQQPPFSVQTSIAYSGELLTSTSSLTASNPQASTIQSFKDEVAGKRRFKEEKTDEPVPTNLLGYQHGPGWNNKTKSTDKSEEKKISLTGIKRGSQKSEDEPNQKKDKNSNGLHLSKDYGYGDEKLEKELKKSEKDGKASEEDHQSLTNDGTLDPHVHPYKVTVSSAPTIYNTSQSILPPSVSFGQYTQPPPDQTQYINAGPIGEQQMYPPPGQPLALSSQSLPIHNPPVPVVSISVPMASQQMPVVSSHPMIPGQPIIASQHIPVFSQPPVPITSQALPAYSQAMPVSNQPYREPSPPLAWGAPAPPPSSIAPPLPPTSFYQSNQPPPHQWNGPEPTYSTPSSQPGFTPGVFTGPPPTSIQYSQPPPPMPYWVGPN
ncbi:hypothetical protein LOTGIDRAFT_232362 [Lottia gigantea]|uniref:KH homology domain-containing protein 4 n=1 Tax=Lottia gigantea TaxID=225164 RepID=V4AH82_LOTGI|nr:hypothetical protein LOTGIDRAFT_232362 [Lottia gigantea]ESO94540.1 hypothetical protein LOTGIDRAFT_232362 [Lottia gigantea]